MKAQKQKWSKQDDQCICDVIIEHIASGKTQREALRKLSKELNKDREQIRNRWHKYLRPTKLKQIEDAETVRKRRIEQREMEENDRLKETDEQIARTIIQHIKSGETQEQAIKQLAQLLPYEPAAIRRRWQNILRPNIKEEVEKAKAKGRQINYIKRLETKIHEHEREIQKLNSLIQEHKEKELP